MFVAFVNGNSNIENLFCHCIHIPRRMDIPLLFYPKRIKIDFNIVAMLLYVLFVGEAHALMPEGKL